MFAPDGRLLAEHDGATGSLIREYIWLDDMPLALVAGSVSSPSYYYVHTGQIGEPLIVTDASKAKVWDAAVDPWGKPTMLATPTQTVSLRLPGQWNASESGLHQNWMRDYDPTTGRYIEADPLGIEAGANLYPYVDSNPLNVTDRKGKFGTPQTAAAGAIIFALADFGWQLYHYDWDWHCVDYWQVGKAALIGAGIGGIGRFLLSRFGGVILGRTGQTAERLATAEGAADAVSGARLAEQLTLDQASSLTTATGELTPGAIANSRSIISAGNLGDTSIPAGFDKFTTSIMPRPGGGTFTTRFYMNPTTGEVYYGSGYKTYIFP